MTTMARKYSRRDFVKLGALTSAGLACSTTGQSQSVPGVSPVSAASPAATIAAPAVLKGASGEVVWYATAPQATLDAVSKKFTETHPGMTMRGVFDAAPGLAQKLSAEVAAKKPIASIIMLPSPVILFDYRNRGLLMQYNSPEEKAYPKWFVESGWWIGARVLDVQLTFNTKLVSQTPNSWEVLTDPAYKGKLAFPDAGTLGGPPLLWYRMLKEKYGPGFWPKVVANQPRIVAQTGQAVDLCVNGEVALIEVYGYEVTTVLKTNPAAPIKGSWPSPTPLTYASNALLASSPNLDGAKVAFDWLAGKDGQQAIVDANGNLSARNDIVYPAGRIKTADLTWAEYDIKQFAVEETALKEEWKKVYQRS